MRLQAITGRHRCHDLGVLRAMASRAVAARGRQTFRRFEWSQPGALLHIDAYSAPKFLRPGTASPAIAQDDRARGLGKTFVIAVQDDHSGSSTPSCTAPRTPPTSRSRSAARRLDARAGRGPLEAVMSDNANATPARVCRHARRARRPPHPHPALHARWNGKLERFFGTLEDEWAHGRVWPNSATRDRALSSFIRYFNRWRPHSSAGGRPPITRVH